MAELSNTSSPHRTPTLRGIDTAPSCGVLEALRVEGGIKGGWKLWGWRGGLRVDGSFGGRGD